MAQVTLRVGDVEVTVDDGLGPRGLNAQSANSLAQSALEKAMREKAKLATRELRAISKEVARLEEELAKRTAGLEEATATIVLAQDSVGTTHRAWNILDGYDGSMDACRVLEARGWTRSGTGGWFSPKAAS